jgi:hypothetical protein
MNLTLSRSSELKWSSVAELAKDPELDFMSLFEKSLEDDED